MPSKGDKYRMLLENLPNAFAYHQIVTNNEGNPVDYIFLDVNNAFEKMTGLSKDQVIGHKITEILSGFENSSFDWIRTYGKVALTGESIRFKNYSEPLNRWYEVTAYSDKSGYFATLFHDITSKEQEQANYFDIITKHKEMEEKLKEREEKYRGLFEKLKAILNFLPDATFVIDTEGKTLIWNKAMEEMTGIKEENILGKGNYEYAVPFYGINRPCLADMVLKPYPEVEKNYTFITKKEDNSLVAEVFCPGIGESGIYAWAKATPIYDSNGNLFGAIESVRDITDRKNVQEAVRDAHRRLDEIIEFLPDATLVIDTNEKVIAWNKAMEEMTGVPKKDMLGKGDYEYAIPFYGKRKPILINLALMTNNQLAMLEQNYDIGRTNKNTIFGEVYCPETYKGRGAYLFASASKLHDTAGNIVGAIETIRDITDRKEVEKKLHTMATTDELTNLWNRRYFMQSVSQEIERAKRYKQYFSVMMLDIDHFKKVNDTQGHAAGDAVLQHLASIIKKNLRRLDIPGRIGGEEFGIILPSTNLEKAALLAERLRKDIENSPAYYNGNEIAFTVSIGVTNYHHRLSKVDELLKIVDDALYKAKDHGRNRVVKTQG